MSCPKWWEKTVEYRFLEMLFTEIFIQRELKPGSCIVPLDGTHEEETGDAILKLSDKWVLIEFKRDETCLSSEIQKYKSKVNYYLAKVKLQKDGTNHFLIYGDSKSSKVLNLKSQLYWGDEPRALVLVNALVVVLEEAQNLAKNKTETEIEDLTEILNEAQKLAESLTQTQTLIQTQTQALTQTLEQAEARVRTKTNFLTETLTKAQNQARDMTKTLAQTQNNNLDSSKKLQITSIFDKGKNYEEFARYLNELKAERKGTEDGTGGGSAVAMSIKDGNLITIPIVKNELDLSSENNLSNNNESDLSSENNLSNNNANEMQKNTDKPEKNCSKNDIPKNTPKP